MQRINAQYFYQLAAAVLPLRTLQSGSIIDSFSILWSAERFLRGYLQNEITSPAASAASGWDLHNALKALTDNPVRDEPLIFQEASNIKDVLLPKFENNLEAEYNTKDVFIVSKKGIYSITELIEGAEQMFSPEIRSRITPAIQDIQQAGRCIAFQVPTAAAFHIFRAVEAVARQYVLKLRGTPVNDVEKKFGLGGFVGILTAHGADQRVTNAVSQLAKLHRNPTMHPDLLIKDDEVIATLGMAQSVIQSMVADMEKRDAHPIETITEVLPTLQNLAYEQEITNEQDQTGDQGQNGVREIQLGDGGSPKIQPRYRKKRDGKRKSGTEDQPQI